MKVNQMTDHLSLPRVVLVLALKISHQRNPQAWTNPIPVLVGHPRCKCPLPWPAWHDGNAIGASSLTSQAHHPSYRRAFLMPQLLRKAIEKGEIGVSKTNPLGCLASTILPVSRVPPEK